MQVATMQQQPASQQTFFPAEFYLHQGVDEHKSNASCQCSMCARARQRKRESESRVRRPMNAFMVWAKLARRQLAFLHPGTHNAELSRMLGAHWKSMSELEKRPYKDQADEIRAAHQRQNPEYRYRPGRREKKKSPRESRRLSRSQHSLSSETIHSAPLPTQQQFFFPQTPITPFTPPIDMSLPMPFRQNTFQYHDDYTMPQECHQTNFGEDINVGMVQSYLPGNFEVNRDEFDRYMHNAPNSAPATYDPVTPPYDNFSPSCQPVFQQHYMHSRPSCDFSDSASPFVDDIFDFDDLF